MLYYNPTTQEKIDRSELKRKLNISFPMNTEEINGWYLLHNGTAPNLEDGQSIIPDAIMFINNKYVQTYKVVGTPIVNTPEVSDIEKRLSALEDGIAELAYIISEEQNA